MSVVLMYKVYENQSWLDISNDIYGHVMYAFELAILNGFSPSDSIPAGKEIFYNSENEKNILVLKSLVSNNSIPATALTSAQNEQIPTPKGIGVMKIDNTFKVD